MRYVSRDCSASGQISHKKHYRQTPKVSLVQSMHTGHLVAQVKEDARQCAPAVSAADKGRGQREAQIGSRGGCTGPHSADRQVLLYLLA